MSDNSNIQLKQKTSLKSNSNKYRNSNDNIIDSNIVDLYQEIRSSSKIIPVQFPKAEIKIHNDEESPFEFLNPQNQSGFIIAESNNDAELDNELIKLKEKDNQSEKKIEAELVNQKEHERQKEMERQVELEEQKEKAKRKEIELENQRRQREQSELKLKELRELRLKREQELIKCQESRKQKEMMIQKNPEEEVKQIKVDNNAIDMGLISEKEKAIERQKEIQRQQESERELEIQKKHQIEMEKEKEYRRQQEEVRNYQIRMEREIQMEKEKENERQKELERLNVMKREQEIEKKKEYERLQEYEREQEIKRQQEYEIQKQKELEQQREYERFQEIEKQQREFEKLQEVERQKEIERLQEIEKQKELESQKEIERLQEIEKQREVESQKEIEKQRELESQQEIEKQRELERLQEIEKQRELESQQEIEKQRELERLEEISKKQKEIEEIEKQEELKKLQEIEKQEEIIRLQYVENEKERKRLKEIESQKEFEQLQETIDKQKEDESLQKLENQKEKDNIEGLASIKEEDLLNQNRSIQSNKSLSKNIEINNPDHSDNIQMSLNNNIESIPILNSQVEPVPEAIADNDNNKISNDLMFNFDFDREYNQNISPEKPQREKKISQEKDIWDEFQWEKEPLSTNQIAEPTQLNPFQNNSNPNFPINLSTSTHVRPEENNDNNNIPQDNKEKNIDCEVNPVSEEDQSNKKKEIKDNENIDMFSHNKNIFDNLNMFNFDMDMPEVIKEEPEIDKEKCDKSNAEDKKDNKNVEIEPSFKFEDKKEVNSKESIIKKEDNDNIAEDEIEIVIPVKTSIVIEKQSNDTKSSKDKQIINEKAKTKIRKSRVSNGEDIVNEIHFDGDLQNISPSSLRSNKAKKKSPLESQPKSNSIQADNNRNRINDSNSLIEKITNQISELNSNEPELNEDYPLIEEFNLKERSLQSDIPTLEKDILNSEGRDILIKRRIGFLNKQYFESSISINNDLLEQLQNCEEPYEQKMQSNMKQSSINLSSSSKDFASAIQNSSNEPSPIENVNHMASFFYQYSLYPFKELMDKYIQSYSKWRYIKCDGNSFYRSFMFSLIEEYICKNNINELTLLIHEICLRVTKEPTLTILQRTNTDPREPILLLKELLTELIDGNQHEAYALLIKGYQLQNDAFDFVLIGYLKGVLYEYVKEIYSLIEKEAEKNNQKANPNQKESIERICYFGIESDFFLICVTSYLFNVNIEILWIDGDYSKPKYDIIKIEDKNKIELPSITLGFVYSSYIKLYPKNLDEITDIFINNPPVPILDKLIHIQKNPEDMMECPKCLRKGPIVFFLQKKFSVCYSCIQTHIDIIITNRAKNYIKDHFLSLEYYTNDIPVYENYTISDNEHMEIFKRENIANSLHQKIESMCFSCGKTVDKLEMLILKCKCQFCNDCLRNQLENSTQGYRVLNIYEKHMFDKALCMCKKPIIIEEVSMLFWDATEEDNKQAAIRLNNYISTMCMQCETKISKNNDASKESFKQVHILEEHDPNKGINYSNEVHFICVNCCDRKKVKDKKIVYKDDKNTKVKKVKKKENEDLNPITIACKICRKKHNIDSKDWNADFGKDDRVCCKENCIIF